jgi:hypothetical protein
MVTPHFHEYKATGMFDGTLWGFWNFAVDPMLDHLDAWDQMDLETGRQIWDGGLSQSIAPAASGGLLGNPTAGRRAANLSSTQI